MSLKLTKGGRATVELDNLENVAINTSLISDTDSTDNLGSSSIFWANAYIDKVFFEADAFLEWENFAGGRFISGRAESSGRLGFLAGNDNISINVRKSGALYGMTLLANTTYGVKLSATKAGGAGHFVIATGTNILPESDSANDFGSSTLFWANIYTDLLHLSSTINIDGSETGVVKFNNADIRPDSDSTRDLGAADVTAKDQSEEGAGNQSQGFFGANWKGQSFTSGSGITNISKVEMFLKAEAGTPDTTFIDIFLAAGDDKPTGASLGQASIPAMTVDDTYAWRVFTFSSPISISASTKYVIVLSSPGSSTWLRAHAISTNPYPDGIFMESTNSGGTWSTNGGIDFKFKTFTMSDFFWAETYTDKLFLNSTATLDGATAGQITVVGDLVFSGAGSGLPYGHTYGTHIGWIQANAAQDTWYNIINASMIDGPLNEVTHDGNGKLTVIKAGVYRVSYSISFAADAANKHIEAGIEINGSGTARPEGQQHFETVGNGLEGNVAATFLLELAADDTLELSVRTTDTGTPTLIIDDIDLTVTMVGGT